MRGMPAPDARHGAQCDTANQIQDNSSGGRMIRAIMASATRMHSSKSPHMTSRFQFPFEGLLPGPGKWYFRARYHGYISEP